MRQFFTVRFWMALLGLAGVTAALWYTVLRDDSLPLSPTLSVPTSDVPIERRINLAYLVFDVRADPGFELVNGVTNAEMQLQLDGTRTIVVKPGTPGEISCRQLAELGKCVVVADLLGDAVLWFSLVPAEPRLSITMPAITEIRDDNWLLLANGWEVLHSDIVDRSCGDEEETQSLTDFVHRFGTDATTTFSFQTQTIVRTTCGRAGSSPTSTTTIDASTTVAAQPTAPVTGG